MMQSTTNYSYNEELSKYGTVNDLTSMRSNNIFNNTLNLGDSNQFIGKLSIDSGTLG